VWPKPETSHEPEDYHESQYPDYGLDVGDKRSVAIVLAPSGEILEELKLQTTRASLDSALAGELLAIHSWPFRCRHGFARMGIATCATWWQERKETRGGSNGTKAGVDFVRPLENTDGF